MEGRQIVLGSEPYSVWGLGYFLVHPVNETRGCRCEFLPNQYCVRPNIDTSARCSYSKPCRMRFNMAHRHDWKCSLVLLGIQHKRAKSDIVQLPGYAQMKIFFYEIHQSNSCSLLTLKLRTNCCEILYTLCFSKFTSPILAVY